MHDLRHQVTKCAPLSCTSSLNLIQEQKFTKYG
jgi:hypothetical protein